MTVDGDPYCNSQCMMYLLLNHTWILWCPKSHILCEVCIIRKPTKWYLIILSPFSKCHSFMFVLNCKFRQHCHFVWLQIQITFHYSLHWLSGYPYLCCILPSWFTGAYLKCHCDSISVLQKCRDESWRCFLSNTLTIIIKLVIKFMNCFEWRRPLCLKMGTNHPCVTTTLLVSVKNNTVFMCCSTDSLPLFAIMCKLAHEQEQHNTSMFGRSKN
jgi:hypothetical protein